MKNEIQTCANSHRIWSETGARARAHTREGAKATVTRRPSQERSRRFLHNSFPTQTAKVEEVREQPPQLQLLEYQPGVEVHVEWGDDLRRTTTGRPANQQAMS